MLLCILRQDKYNLGQSSLDIASLSVADFMEKVQPEPNSREKNPGGNMDPSACGAEELTLYYRLPLD